ncbi:hypothetical protein [Pandoraea iniqua]|uniref:hypothetical protein n=1 Tax=Pandoraea iniqua TaxID=2508288 RepID=UPI001581E4DA|nr:hypothetical protein [Pandoraea iniqua]
MHIESEVDVSAPTNRYARECCAGLQVRAAGKQLTQWVRRACLPILDRAKVMVLTKPLPGLPVEIHEVIFEHLPRDERRALNYQLVSRHWQRFVQRDTRSVLVTGPTGLGGLNEYHQLKSVVLRGTFADSDLARLPTGNYALELRDCRGLSVAGIDHLLRLELGSLHLVTADEPLGPDVAIVLAQHPTLTELVIKGHQVGDSGAKALAKNQVLRTLAISANGISDEGGAAFGENSTLEALSLGSNAIGAATILALAKTQLQSLCLRYCELSGESLAGLAGLKTLTRLDISCNYIGNVGVQALLNDANQLQWLDVSANGVGDAGARTLATHPGLRTLIATHNPIRREGALALVLNETLETIYLSIDGNAEFGPALTLRDIPSTKRLWVDVEFSR